MDSDEILFELNGILEVHRDDNETETVAKIEKTIALLEDNPDQAEMIWETFMNLLDCASRSEANHWFGYKIERF
jgi:hypothetical protein